MTTSKLQEHLLQIITGLCIAILLLVPFHALLTIWAADNFGHYTTWRLWKEFLLVIAALLGGGVLLLDVELRRSFARSWLLRLIGCYALLVLIAGVVAYTRHAVTRTAVLDGIILDLRFLLFFTVTWVLTKKTSVLYMNWRKLLLGPAVVVVLIGVLQRFVLPIDFLRHFGYGPNTIDPYETVDQKRAYVRLQSTLRGANPLGAYLVVVLTAMATLVTRVKIRWHKALWIVVGLLSLLVLFFTYSRSALLGAVISVAILIVLGLRNRPQLWRLGAVVIILILLAVAGSFAMLKDNDRFQNTFFHTDEHSHSTESSNSGHVQALRNGLEDITRNPLGSGTGTAGPASAHNDGQVRIAEDYFVQIGQETGVIGAGLFIAICVTTGLALARRERDSLARVLLASLIGISVIGLFSHVWTDDTLAYLWWGFAGVALARLRERSAPDT
ncbi:MAG: O-antigen ligase family protein [Candidatus Saccharimonadales bacterium]